METQTAGGHDVAVLDGKTSGCGYCDCADAWPKAQGNALHHDNSLAESVLMPVWSKGHAHMVAAPMWDFAMPDFMIGWDPRANGGKRTSRTLMPWCAICPPMKTAPSRPTTPAGMGLDPIFFEGERLSRKHLDQNHI